MNHPDRAEGVELVTDYHGIPMKQARPAYVPSKLEERALELLQFEHDLLLEAASEVREAIDRIKRGEST